MASVNKVILVGHLGKDPEVRYMPNGNAVVDVSVATSETWKDKQSGDKREKTEWHRVVFFSRLAEIVGEYLKKGSQVYIEGRLQTDKWQDKSGQDRYTTKINASEMKMLGSKGGGGGDNYGGGGGGGGGGMPADDYDQSASQSSSQAPAKNPSQQGAAQPAEDFDDDIPF